MDLAGPGRPIRSLGPSSQNRWVRGATPSAGGNSGRGVVDGPGSRPAKRAAGSPPPCARYGRDRGCGTLSGPGEESRRARYGRAAFWRTGGYALSNSLRSLSICGVWLTPMKSASTVEQAASHHPSRPFSLLLLDLLFLVGLSLPAPSSSPRTSSCRGRGRGTGTGDSATRSLSTTTER